MRLLFIASTGNHAGQTLVTWAIARRLREKGLKVGFFKPFGTDPVKKADLWADRDALLFKEVLQLEDSLSDLCPFYLSEPVLEEMDTKTSLEGIKSSLAPLCDKRDVVLIMGSNEIFSDTGIHPIPDSTIIRALNAGVLLVHRFVDLSSSIYSILSVYSLLRDRVRGIIINRVAPEAMDLIETRLTSLLAEKGIEITACIPEVPILSYRSLRNVLDLLDGEILWGEDGLERPFGGMTVGSAELQGELGVLKRVYNKIVLLDPSPIGEEPSTQRTLCGILLTGGRRPPRQVLDAARRAKVPLMLTEADTFEALDRLERSPPSLSPKEEEKVKYFQDLMDRDGALERVLIHLR